MKRWLHLGLWLCLAATVAAQEKVLKIYDWKDLPGPSSNCQIVSMDGMPVLKIENTNEGPLEKPFAMTITDSSLIQKAKMIEWDMKYENVYGPTNKNPLTGFGAHAEVYETFPPEAIGGDSSTNQTGFFFYGTKNWGKYGFQIIPARYDNETPPNKLTLKLSLPSKGTVYLRPIKLVKWVNPNSGSWWSPEQSGLIGGIGGSLIGCFGGVIGWLVSKGKARKFVLSATGVAIVLGLLLTIGGLVAAVLKQPYSVWYALLFPGVILVLVFSLNLHSIQRRYDELEIRRMTSMDTGS